LVKITQFESVTLSAFLSLRIVPGGTDTGFGCLGR
jgi:hypothetical protein